MDKGTNFARYRVQIGSDTYGVVHVQVEAEFGSDVIQNAFRASVKTQSHIFLCAEGSKPNLPKNKVYKYRIFKQNQSSRNNIRRFMIYGIASSLLYLDTIYSVNNYGYRDKSSL